MARVHLKVQGVGEGDIELNRVPVAGDYVSRGKAAVQVMEVVLFPPGAPVDGAVLAIVPHNLSDTVKEATERFGLAESA